MHTERSCHLAFFASAQYKAPIRIAHAADDHESACSSVQLAELFQRGVAPLVQIVGQILQRVFNCELALRKLRPKSKESEIFRHFRRRRFPPATARLQFECLRKCPCILPRAPAVSAFVYSVFPVLPPRGRRLRKGRRVQRSLWRAVAFDIAAEPSPSALCRLEPRTCFCLLAADCVVGEQLARKEIQRVVGTSVICGAYTTVSVLFSDHAPPIVR